MIHAQNVKYFSLIAPVQIATDATNTGTVDTRGYEYATFMIHVDSNAAASNNASVMDLQEGSVTNVSSHTTVSGFVGDSDFTIPATAGKHIVLFQSDLRARERYLSVQLTGIARIHGVAGFLSRAKETPITDAASGAAEIVVG
jgi:hypothetical protein